MSCLVTALFYDWGDMQRAIEALIARGVSEDQLSLMVNRSRAGEYFEPVRPRLEAACDGNDGPLAALTENLVAAAPGSTAILASGPLVTALAARGTHSFVGGISAGLCSLGIAEHEAAFCEHSIRVSNALLLGVMTNERPDGMKAYLRWFGTAGPSDDQATAN